MRADGLDVRPFEVRATDREVEHWAQPLVAPRGTEEVVLLGQRRRGVLQFLLRAAVEPGFAEGVQLGPSAQTRDGVAPADELSRTVLAADPRLDRARVLQSDEGGRFHRSVARYRVVHAPDGAPLPEQDDAIWVTLGRIQALALGSGLLTNEARSAISLLLPEV
jgi:oxidase EvaA